MDNGIWDRIGRKQITRGPSIPVKEIELSSRPICIVLVCEHRSVDRTDLGVRKWVSKDQGAVYDGAFVLRRPFPSSKFARALFVLGYVHVLRA